MAKEKKLDANYLDFVPQVPDSQKYEINDAGEVTLFQENKGLFNLIAQKLFKKPRISQIHLDEMGNFIWPLIDGERSVYDIAVLVKEHFGDKAEPLYDRLCKYISMLVDYGFLVLKE